MFDVQIFGVSAVLAIMTLVKLAQDIGFPKKFSPILAIGLGIVTGVFLVDPHDLQQGLVDGLSLGLSAIGVHSGVKNIREGIVNLVKKPDQVEIQQPQQQTQPIQQSQQPQQPQHR